MATVLVIDDEPAVGEALRRVLEREGYAVTVVNGGPAGVRALDQAPADVVITDIIMPKTHGIDVIRAIRTKHANTRIVAMSGGGNFGPLAYEPEAITTSAYLAAAKQAGADEVLTKPFDKNDLIAAIKRLLPQ
ncbi:MAG: response regulator [Steroidobacterales bacterium]